MWPHSQAGALVAVTRDSAQSAEYAGIFSDMLRSVVRGSSVREAAEATAKKIGYDVARAARGGDPVTA